MNRPLILGLGNSLMGDDGVGIWVADLLSADPTVTAHADVIAAGTDLLNRFDDFTGRTRVILVDAIACEGEPGRISVVDEAIVEDSRQFAHSLSAPQVVELFQTVMPHLRNARFTWVLIGVASAGIGRPISTAVAAAVQPAADLVKGML
jgi:hydrogenase maturation protease